ncbi:MAG: bifunctional hydroxymethylpyrimidine kinase/phosphomethylpyrimidine kinase [Methanocellales archaeon]|nr:bifunctional hydroxymethylpyrimidine kinase/phosphomethylpyrimidine kinase [Methanocellales archaeon]
MNIAGSDSGGGAGIQADLNTFAALGVHGTCAITSVTAQNTLGVQSVHDLPIEVIVDHTKTGMLSSAEIVRAVAQQMREHKMPLVVDPVMKAETGGCLLRRNAISVGELFPWQRL